MPFLIIIFIFYASICEGYIPYHFEKFSWGQPEILTSDMKKMDVSEILKNAPVTLKGNINETSIFELFLWCEEELIKKYPTKQTHCSLDVDQEKYLLHFVIEFGDKKRNTVKYAKNVLLDPQLIKIAYDHTEKLSNIRMVNKNLKKIPKKNVKSEYYITFDDEILNTYITSLNQYLFLCDHGNKHNVREHN